MKSLMDYLESNNYQCKVCGDTHERYDVDLYINRIFLEMWKKNKIDAIKRFKPLIEKEIGNNNINIKDFFMYVMFSQLADGIVYTMHGGVLEYDKELGTPLQCFRKLLQHDGEAYWINFYDDYNGTIDYLNGYISDLNKIEQPLDAFWRIDPKNYHSNHMITHSYANYRKYHNQ